MAAAGPRDCSYVPHHPDPPRPTPSCPALAALWVVVGILGLIVIGTGVGVIVAWRRARVRVLVIIATDDGMERAQPQPSKGFGKRVASDYGGQPAKAVAEGVHGSDGGERPWSPRHVGYTSRAVPMVSVSGFGRDNRVMPL